MIRGLNVAKTDELVNIGVGHGVSILEMAYLIKDYVGYQGVLNLDPSKPDGAPFKTVDGSRGKKLFKWTPGRDFNQGIKDTIQWYLTNEVKSGC